ncbi:LacI family DNA-binding transcriptional regulator [Catenulispora rubra]|uniref:LacI family DNA-binding transcriptional regulator n=1 Tax=Catenulispora rubra TaxID=280293 RepID=UPI00189248EF|nr:LacI family DNA-binding transcriptional regulator [Catenulispora rubra]
MAAQERRPAKGAVAPTQTDVARAAGVSGQTVSNVLRAPERVRPATRERVEQAIAELGYRPNRLAQALRESASRMIGYRIEPLAPGALASIHDRFLHALAEAGRAADHHLVLFTAADEASEAEAVARMHRTGAADSFVLYDITADDSRPAALLAAGVPFVAFGRTATGVEAYPWVDVDNVVGTGSAVDHLVHRGHRRIAFIGWPAGQNVGDRRSEGFQQAIERHGLTTSLGLEMRCEDSVTIAAQMAFHLLEQPDPPTAFVTATDTLAVGVMGAVHRWGLEVGRDVAIVGFDDTPTAAALDLSSIRQPIELVGQRVIAALLGDLPADQQLLTPRLVIRGSSASPARGVL